MTTSLAPLYIEIEDYKKPIKIDKFVIRQIEDKERELIFGIKDLKLEGKGYSYNKIESEKYLIKNNFANQHMIFVDYIIEYNRENSDKFYLEMNLRKFLLAFNLYQEGRIDAPYMIIDKGVMYDMQTRGFTGEKYVIKEKDFKEVEIIFSSIINNKNKKIKLLLERFRSTYFSNLRKENIFIELMSIIESLLDVGNAELSYRLSLYASYLLTNKCGYEIGFNKIKSFYNIRSELIHKGTLKKGLKDEDLILLRRCTAKLLLLSLQDIKKIEDIDLEIKTKLKIA